MTKRSQKCAARPPKAPKWLPKWLPKRSFFVFRFAVFSIRRRKTPKGRPKGSKRDQKGEHFFDSFFDDVVLFFLALLPLNTAKLNERKQHCDHTFQHTHYTFSFFLSPGQGKWGGKPPPWGLEVWSNLIDEEKREVMRKRIRDIYMRLEGRRTIIIVALTARWGLPHRKDWKFPIIIR